MNSFAKFQGSPNFKRNFGTLITFEQFKFEKFKFTFEFSGAGAGTHVPLSGPELGMRVPVPPYRVRIRIDQLR